MLIKIIIVLVLIAIIGLMGSALLSLIREPATAENTNIVKKLSWRIGLSISLFLLLLLASHFGWIHPHGVGQ